MEHFHALLLTFLEMTFIFVGLGMLYSQRRAIGKAPFYMALGLLFLFSHFVSAAEIRTVLFGTIDFEVGRIVIFLPILTAYLMVYITEGTLAAQRIIIGAAVLFGLYLYLGELTRLQCNWYGFSLTSGTEAVTLDNLLGGSRNSMNLVALSHLFDFLVLPIAYTRFKNFGLGRFFCILGALLTALLLGALLGLVFWLTIQGANVPSALLQRGFDAVEGVLWAVADSFHAPSWLSGALIAGVYQTTAKVVSVMLPPVLIFFPLFTLLEDSGYLPRVAFLLDAGFERCGSCGKQALTMCMGFGCNAAGVSGCRIIDSEREKRIGMLTNALVPCNGRFPTLLTLSAIFFGGTACSAALVLTGCVLLGAAMTMAASFVLGKTILRGAPSHFTLELPPFRMPNVGRVLVRSVMDRSLFVLGRAAAIAAPAGLLLWLLGNVQIGGETILTFVARALEPVGAWLGMDGAILLAFALSFPANELLLPVWVMIVSSGATLAQAQTADVGGLLLSSGWTMKTALCVMVFTLFHFPCSTTVLTIRKETGSTRWALLGMLLPAAIGVLFCRLLNLLL